jgi:hypothetical protein
MRKTTRKITAGSAHVRWGLLSGVDIGADGDPYLDRLRLIETPLFAVYLHHIHREDRDPDPHDHPWAFASLVLAGAYREQVWPDKRTAGRGLGAYVIRHRGRGSLRRLGRQAAHRITVISPPLWTLVITGPRRGEWGFWVHGQLVPWREYTGPGNDVIAGERGRRIPDRS